MPGQWQVEPAPSAADQELRGAAPALDPYFRWAQHTQWRGYRRLCGWAEYCPRPNDPNNPNDPNEAGEPAGQPQGSDQQDSEPQEFIQIIVRATTSAARDAAFKPDDNNPLRIPDIYREPLKAGGKLALHFSATLPRDPTGFKWLNTAHEGLEWKLALPARDAEALAKAVPNGLFGESRDSKFKDVDNLLKAALKDLPERDLPRRMDGLLALIDFGCPFLNEVYDNDKTGGTRVAALWDQGVGPRPGTPGWPWRPPPGFARGRHLGPKALKTIVATARDEGRRLEETAVYRSIDYLIDYDDPRRRIRHNTHGGHLLDVLGGKPDPLTRGVAPPVDDEPAAAAPLVFVQLPFEVAMDSSGGSLAPHLLDGVRYAISLCQDDAPLVVNISYGGQAGPHDGSSIIETALDELLRLRDKNFAIVLAAGNARRSQCHARRVLSKERSVLLRCQVPAGDTTDTHVEVWYERTSPWVQFRVRAPQGVWTAWLGSGTHGGEALMHDLTRPKDVVAVLRHDAHVPIGARALALLSLAPTLQPLDVQAAAADPGIWEVEVRLDPDKAAEKAEVTLDAWIERDDPAKGSTARPPCFIDVMDGDDLDTLCSIATGAKTLRVAGFNRGTGEPAPYSSPGFDTRRPQVMATCEEDALTPSVAAAATRSGEVLRMNGTSVAAPVMARRLFNHLKNQPAPLKNARVLAAALQLARGADPDLRPMRQE